MQLKNCGGENTAIKQNHELSLNSDALHLRKCLNTEKKQVFWSKLVFCSYWTSQASVYSQAMIRTLFKYCYCARGFLRTEAAHKKDITKFQKPLSPVTNNHSTARCIVVPRRLLCVKTADYIFISWKWLFIGRYIFYYWLHKKEIVHVVRVSVKVHRFVLLVVFEFVFILDVRI